MISKSIVEALVGAAILLMSAIMLKVAQEYHAISADAAARGAHAMIGLTLAVYANFMTKQPTKAPPTELGGHGQAAVRTIAWLFFVAGLVYAAASAFAPRPADQMLGLGAVGTATAISIGIFIRARARCA